VTMSKTSLTGGCAISSTWGSVAESALAEIRRPDNLRVYVPGPPGAESYPIVTLAWILLRSADADPERVAGLIDLFRWCLTDG
jgi:phosphate transport system substrate-binding protein